MSWAVLIALSVLVVRRDERRLARRDPDALERAWSPVSRDNALIGLSLLFAPVMGLFAVFWHFARTRRFRPPGLALGLGWLLVVLAGNALVTTLAALALGIPLD